jgi:hypothetical protein
MAASTKQRGNATGICTSSVETDCGLDEEDSNASPVTTSSALASSDPDGEVVVKAEATPESGQIAATTGTNQRGEAAGSCGSVEECGGAGRKEEDSKPSLVTSSALLIGSYSDQVAVQEEVTTPNDIPSGWTRVKLEPDC